MPGAVQGEDSGGKAVHGGIGERNCLCFGLEAQDRQDGAEKLGIEDGQIGGWAVDDRGFIVGTAKARGLFAAHQHFAALVLRQGHLPLNVAQLALGAQGPHLGLFGQGITDADDLGHRHHLFKKLIGHAFMHDQPRACDTALPGRPENPGNRAVHRAFNIGIFKDDEGRLAAQFQRHFGEVLGRVLQDRPCGIGAAGKGDAGDQGMAGQHPAHLGMAGDDVHHSGRKACLFDQPTEVQHGHRGMF